MKKNTFKVLFYLRGNQVNVSVLLDLEEFSYYKETESDAKYVYTVYHLPQPYLRLLHL